MNKIMMVLCMIMCLFATNAFAQEKVRGIETKLVKYDTYECSGRQDVYGVMFTNRNSIPVSVTMELWISKEYQGPSYNRTLVNVNALDKSKDIVLDPNESYLWKINKGGNSNGELFELCSYFPSYYYYKYEAYKLQ